MDSIGRVPDNDGKWKLASKAHDGASELIAGRVAGSPPHAGPRPFRYHGDSGSCWTLPNAPQPRVDMSRYRQIRPRGPWVLIGDGVGGDQSEIRRRYEVVEPLRVRAQTRINRSGLTAVGEGRRDHGQGCACDGTTTQGPIDIGHICCRYASACLVICHDLIQYTEQRVTRPWYARKARSPRHAANLRVMFECNCQCSMRKAISRVRRECGSWPDRALAPSERTHERRQKKIQDNNVNGDSAFTKVLSACSTAPRTWA